MKDWKTFWRNQIAPVMRARKKQMGRAQSETSIAHAVAQATGQDSSRSLLAMWLAGDREPTVTQFMALCERMDLEPEDALAGRLVLRAVGALTHNSGRKFFNAGNTLDIPRSETTTHRKAKVIHRR